MNKLIIIYLYLIVVLPSCNSQESKYSIINNNSKIVKIIETRSFHAKQHFDEIVAGAPAIFMDEEKILGMDRSWNVKYLDTYGNIVKQELIQVDRNSLEEVIYSTTHIAYSNPERGQTREILRDKGTEKFVRDQDGRLNEIVVVDANGEINNKTIFKYNETTQELEKKEKYEESGLVESLVYYINENGLFVEERKNIKEKYSSKKVYKKDLIENIIYEKEYFYSDPYFSNVKESMEYVYKDFVGRLPQIEIMTGFNTYTETNTFSGEVREINSGLHRITTRRKFDSQGRLIEHSRYNEDLEKEEAAGNLETTPLHNSYFLNVNTFEYTNNKYNEWIEVIETNGDKKYITQRKIRYIQ